MDRAEVAVLKEPNLITQQAGSNMSNTQTLVNPSKQQPQSSMHHIAALLKPNLF
jgi:hypothetical protein